MLVEHNDEYLRTCISGKLCLARFYIKIDLTHRTATRTLESSAISMLY